MPEVLTLHTLLSQTPETILTRYVRWPLRPMRTTLPCMHSNTPKPSAFCHASAPHARPEGSRFQCLASALYRLVHSAPTRTPRTGVRSLRWKGLVINSAKEEAQPQGTICTSSVSLQASAKMCLIKHCSPSYGSFHLCSYSEHSQDHDRFTQNTLKIMMVMCVDRVWC